MKLLVRATLISTLLTCSLASAQSVCREVFEEPIGPRAIIPDGEGVGVESVAIVQSVISEKPIYWLAEHSAWHVHPSGADVPGDPRWGVAALGRSAAYFGFNRQMYGGRQIYSIPSIAHGNWAINDYNHNLRQRANRDSSISYSDLAIPLRLKAVEGLSSDRDFLNDFINGYIPVARDRAQSFIHDIDYHFLAVLRAKPQFWREWQQRTQGLIRLYEYSKEKFKDDPIVREHIDLLIWQMASRIDQTGNISDYLFNEEMRRPIRANPSSGMLIYNGVSGSRLPFYEAVIADASKQPIVPDLSTFVAERKISEQQKQIIEAQYPKTNRQHSAHLYLQAKLNEALSEIKSEIDGFDSTIQAMIDALRATEPLKAEAPLSQIHRSWTREL